MMYSNLCLSFRETVPLSIIFYCNVPLSIVLCYTNSHVCTYMFVCRGQRIHFEQLGVATTTSPGYDTLANIMAKNGHQHITYLKVLVYAMSPSKDL